MSDVVNYVEDEDSDKPTGLLVMLYDWIKKITTQTPKQMKLSVHFGINKYDPSYYAGTPNLSGCVNDATFMQSLCKSNGFKTVYAKDNQCTKDTFIKNVKFAIDKLKAGDIFCFTQSSHGTYTIKNGKRITGICMYDQIMWDYEIGNLLAEFKPGVLIIWITDSCFAEDNFKFLMSLPGQIKFLNSTEILKKNNTVINDEKSNKILASVINFASSNSFQPSYDLGANGLFTASLRDAIKVDPNFNYYKLYLQIVKEMATSGYPQTPVLGIVNGDDKATTYNKFLDYKY